VHHRRRHERDSALNHRPGDPQQVKNAFTLDGCPSLDFLLSLAALTTCMRLSSMKAAHAVLSGAA
jgi:hypothetical protein